MGWDLYGSIGLTMKLLKPRLKKWCSRFKWIINKLYDKLGKPDATSSKNDEFQQNPIDNPDLFLEKVSGVIHVGANIGQERDLYAKHNLHVVWIEPIPEVFNQLKSNLKSYYTQQAYQCLVTDKDGELCEFHISNNDGLSSSILDLYQHKDIWPEVHYQRNITLSSITLNSLVKKEKINIKKYDALILDTQGSELLVLKGAGDLLDNFKFVKVEVPDFESYKDCPQADDIDRFLRPYGFSEYSRNRFAVRSKGGSYYDILYKKGDSY